MLGCDACTVVVNTYVRTAACFRVIVSTFLHLVPPGNIFSYAKRYTGAVLQAQRGFVSWGCIVTAHIFTCAVASVACLCVFLHIESLFLPVYT